MQSKSKRRLGAAVVAAAAMACVAGASAATGSIQCPSSSAEPYLVRSEPGVVTKSILTTGDSVSGYQMAGIPDGLGAYDNGDGTFTVLMNHELPANRGGTHDHGAIGAFVSKWTVDKETLEVTQGDDLIKQIATWNIGAAAHDAPALGVAIGRLCSADLPAPSAFFDAAGGDGYDGRIFMSGEETGAEGRVFGHVVDGADAGTSFELPHLGKFSWENSVANPGTGEKTVVVGLDDSTPGEVYVYHGDKGTAGSAVQRAGLVGGTLSGIKVSGYASEPADTGIPSGTPFTLTDHGNVAAKSGATLQSESNSLGDTKFQRPEDGHWDPRDPSRFYFVTTASFTGKSRLWRLNFEDPADPSKGGTLDMLLDGSEGQRMMDNITVDRRGRVLIQEDPGNQDYIAKVRRYDSASDTLTTVAQHDPDRFAPGGSAFLTKDEESSGIIDVGSILGSGWYLADVQVHHRLDDPLVEPGQLLALRVPAGRGVERRR